jgi:hypothetical protein
LHALASFASDLLSASEALTSLIRAATIWAQRS